MVTFEKYDFKDWQQFRMGAKHDIITPTEFTLVCNLHSKYYKHRFYKNIIKLYFVNDPKGNFMYWLNTLKMPIPIKKYCPDTTMWTKKRLLKDVYLLKENEASRININIS